MSLHGDEFLDFLLRKHARRNGTHERFWPYALLARLMTRERLKSAFIQGAPRSEDTVEEILDNIGVLYDSNSAPPVEKPLQEVEAIASRERTGYLRICAALVLSERLETLPQFIDANLNDAALFDLRIDENFRKYKTRSYTYRKNVDTKFQMFKNWKHSELDYLIHLTESLYPPCFETSELTSTPILTLSDDVVLPFTGNKSKTPIGGFGAVSEIILDPLSYSFPTYGHSKGVFALKTIPDLRINLQLFEAEIEILRHLGPHSHDHIIPLLMAFKQEDEGFLIFPWASCNLREYWHRQPLVLQDPTQVRWFSAQVLGLATALCSFHNINVRHGDIKPENILHVSGPSEEPESGKLVIADFGVARSHKNDTGMRAVTTTDKPFTADYRSPEFDMVDTVRSRKEDIWSFGCVLLEAACWMLQGSQGVQRF